MQGKGCPKCVGKNKTTEEFIEEAKKVHDDKYDYSKTILRLTRNKIIIICPNHGEFEQTANSHLRGSGCPTCTKNKRKTTEEFIEVAKKVHGNKYDYSKTIYKGIHSKVIIICPHHGEFEQSPGSHMHNSCGCPSCSYESVGEKMIKEFLDVNNVRYKRQKTFNGCKHKNKLRFDFYIQSLNICIEFDGIQHYESIEVFGGEKGLIENKIKDNIKNKFCDDNNISLLRIKYSDDIIEKLTKIL